MKRYDYFEHDADIGIIGRGETLEAAFVSAAEALFAIMGDPGEAALDVALAFEFEESDVELALVRWLNLLIAHAQSRFLLPGRFELKREGTRWQARAWGTPWRDTIERGVEVKGATLTMLAVETKPDGFEARCVVDV